MNAPISRPCSVIDCARPVGSHGAKGMCARHYKRWKKHGSTVLPSREPAACFVDGCGRRAHARQMCTMHYQRWERLGSTELAAPSLADRLAARLDRSAGLTACWVWTGYVDRKGYGQIGDQGRLLYTHRVAWELANNACVLPGFVVRHRCDNPPCCNPAHLELGTDVDNVNDMIERRRAWWFRPDAADVHERSAATRRRSEGGRSR